MATADSHEAAKQLVSERAPAARDWYLRSLLPAIEADPSLARNHERAAISEIRWAAPGADLGTLAAEVMPIPPIDKASRVRFQMLIERLGALIAENKGDRAENLYRMFDGATSVGSLDELLRMVRQGDEFRN